MTKKELQQAEEMGKRVHLSTVISKKNTMKGLNIPKYDLEWIKGKIYTIKEVMVNAPATFQRLMETCLHDLQFNWCLIYVNDIIVFFKMPEDHLVKLRAVFKKLKEAGLKLKPSKCEFLKKSHTYLGHRFSELMTVKLK